MISESLKKVVDIEINSLKLKILGLNFLRWFFGIGGVVFFATGFGIAVYKIFYFENYIVRFILPVIIFLFLIIISLFISYKSLPEKSQLLSLLDKHNQCGGLLIAAHETNIGSWIEKIRLQKNNIKFNIDLKNKIAIFVLAIAFCFCSNFVPKLNYQKSSFNKFEISDNADDLKNQLDILKDEDIIEEEEAEELEQSINEIEKNAVGENPEKTLEALEHMEENLSNKAQLAEEKALAQMANLEATEQVAQKMEEALKNMSEKERKESLSAMNDMLNKLAKEDKNFQKMLKNQQLAMKQSLGSKDLMALKNGCNMSKEQLQKMLNNLKNNNLLNKFSNKLSNMKKNNGKGRLDNQQLLQFLKKNCSGSRSCNKLSSICGGGNGGTNRGPGSVPLMWKRRYNTYKGNYKDEGVTGDITSLDDSVLLQEIYTESQAGDYEKSKVGSLNNTKAKKVDNKSYSLQPKHRKAVGKFFERK
ncbi:hypothetical protein AAEX28_02990 [Lentisphaerota bacterium WC36G]|nr:hypothetical protein LJT99_05870 [Lentisphaerae bacterium WC36]